MIDTLIKAAGVALILFGALCLLPDYGPEDCGRGEERPRRPKLAPMGIGMIIIGGTVLVLLGRAQ